MWPETFLFCPLYVFIHFSAAFCLAHCSFLYGALCPRSCYGSCAKEMPIIIIIIMLVYSFLVRSRIRLAWCFCHLYVFLDRDVT